MPAPPTTTICDGCGINFENASFEYSEGRYCCRPCALGDRCLCGALEIPRGGGIPFSQTGLKRPDFGE